MINVLIMIAGLLYSFPGKAEELVLIRGQETYSIPEGTCNTVFLYDFTKLDGRQGPFFERAMEVCYKKYGPRSPCLVRFEQVGANDYKATCGAKHDSK